MVIVLFLTAFFSQAQESSQNDLELKRRALLQEIQLTTHLLSQIRKEKEVSLNQFLLLEKQIKQREELVWGIQRDIQSTQMRIGKLKKEIEYNEDRYRELIEQYTTFLQASYRLSLQQNKWVFIFSTASINQIFQRWRYLSRLKNASFNQFSLLQSLQDSLVQRKSILERRKEEQTGLMLSQNDQKTLLARDLSIKQQTLNRLNQDEKGLSSHLKKQMSEQERLNAEIRKIIDEASHRWPLLGWAVSHRIGTLKPNEVSVVVAVSAPHRKESFEACQFIIDTLKAKVPIWKKEVFEDGEEWVSARPGGVSASYN